MVKTESTVLISWLPYWLNALNPGADVFSRKGLKNALGEHGVHGGGLRLYLTMGDRLFAVMGSRWIRREDPQLSARSAIALLRLVQDGQITGSPPNDLIRIVLDSCADVLALERFPAALFRAAWREVLRAQNEGMTEAGAVQRQIAPILRWALNDWSKNQPDSNQIKAGWERIQRRYEQELGEIERPSGKREWCALFGSAQFGDVRFLPLTNDAALVDEGERMQHCIANYFEDFSLGRTHQAFSARDGKTLKRLATLALFKVEGAWHIEELKAFRNNEPAPNVVAAARALVKWLNRNYNRASKS